MRMLNLGKPTEVTKLNEAMAIELGAELLGEGIIFVVAAGCLVAEYIRSSNKEREKEENREKRFQDLQRSLVEMELRLEEQETRMRELNRMSFGMHASLSNLWNRGKKDDDKGKVSEAKPTDLKSNPKDAAATDIITRALEDVNVTIKGK